jgi:hypothetical protein
MSFYIYAAPAALNVRDARVDGEVSVALLDETSGIVCLRRAVGVDDPALGVLFTEHQPPVFVNNPVLIRQ